jgi:hypothetical protein
MVARNPGDRATRRREHRRHQTGGLGCGNVNKEERFWTWPPEGVAFAPRACTKSLKMSSLINRDFCGGVALQMLISIRLRPVAVSSRPKYHS